MKYFFVSDLHGCEPALLHTALEQKHFDPANDTLVIVGDIVDRGFYSYDLIHYVNSLPHVIRIWGNHDRRTREVILGIGHKPDKYDTHNGVASSLHSFCGFSAPDSGLPTAHKVDSIWYYLHSHCIHNPIYKERTTEFLADYCSKCVWALEFDDLFVTHAWLPYSIVEDGNGGYTGHLVRAIPFLSGLHQSYWEDAVWGNTFLCLKYPALFNPHKRILVGHWWAGDIRARFIQHRLFDDVIKDGTVDFSTFITADGNTICIDPCIQLSYTVNVYVYESDKEPVVYITQEDQLVNRVRISEAGL